MRDNTNEGIKILFYEPNSFALKRYLAINHIDRIDVRLSWDQDSWEVWEMSSQKGAGFFIKAFVKKKDAIALAEDLKERTGLQISYPDKEEKTTEKILWIKETYINQTKGYNFGNSEWYQPYTTNKGRLFRDFQKEFGKCVSSVYVDLVNGGAEKIGWVFEKKMQYDDCRDFYVREVWVELREESDEE